MAETEPIRYPIEPLVEIVAGRVGPGPSAEAVAQRVGVTERTVLRWRHNGLTRNAADHAATALYLHPVNIWDEWDAPT